MTAPLFLHSSPVGVESTRRSVASCHKAAPLPSCGAGEREEAARRPLKGAQGKRGRVTGPGLTTHACSLPCSLLVFLTPAAASAWPLKTRIGGRSYGYGHKCAQAAKCSNPHLFSVERVSRPNLLREWRIHVHNNACKRSCRHTRKERDAKGKKEEKDEKQE